MLSLQHKEIPLGHHIVPVGPHFAVILQTAEVTNPVLLMELLHIQCLLPHLAGPFQSTPYESCRRINYYNNYHDK